MAKKASTDASSGHVERERMTRCGSSSPSTPRPAAYTRAAPASSSSTSAPPTPPSPRSRERTFRADRRLCATVNTWGPGPGHPCVPAAAEQRGGAVVNTSASLRSRAVRALGLCRFKGRDVPAHAGTARPAELPQRERTPSRSNASFVRSSRVRGRRRARLLMIGREDARGAGADGAGAVTRMGLGPFGELGMVEPGAQGARRVGRPR